MHAHDRSHAIGLPRAVIFDLDGTLVDSAADIAEALNVATRPHGAGDFSGADVTQMIGGGSLVLIRKALASRELDLDERGWQATQAAFMAAYHDVSALGRGLYPGAHALLDGMLARGCRIALCTNKPEAVTHVAVAALGLAGRLHAIIGARDDVPKKPDPAMVLAALEALGVSPVDSIMVGDSQADVGAARAASVRSIVLRHGYSKAPVETLGADWVIADLVELRQAFAASVPPV